MASRPRLLVSEGTKEERDAAKTAWDDTTRRRFMALREGLGVSQADWAVVLGLDERTVRRVENGETPTAGAFRDGAGQLQVQIREWFPNLPPGAATDAVQWAISPTATDGQFWGGVSRYLVPTGKFNLEHGLLAAQPPPKNREQRRARTRKRRGSK